MKQKSTTGGDYLTSHSYDYLTMRGKALKVITCFALIFLIMAQPALASGGYGSGWGDSGFWSKLKTMAIAFNAIPSSEISFCQPVATDYWYYEVPQTKNCGVYKFDLKDFSLDNMPSGGASNRISSSEMAMVTIKISNYQGSGSIKHSWYNADTNKLLYTFTKDIPACAGNCNWEWWYWTTYSFIGHFSWEINKPGNYYALLETTWGNSRIDFTVTDSTPVVTATATASPTPTSTPTPFPIWTPPPTPGPNAPLVPEGVHIGERPGYAYECEPGLVKEIDPAWYAYWCVKPKVTATASPTPEIVNGAITVWTIPSGAKIIVNGVEKATTTTGYTTLSLAPGTYSVKLSKNGYYDYEGSAVILPSETKKLDVTLTAIPGDTATSTATATTSATANSTATVTTTSTASSTATATEPASEPNCKEGYYFDEDKNGCKLIEKKNDSIIYIGILSFLLIAIAFVFFTRRK